jgi:hypothetical protein
VAEGLAGQAASVGGLPGGHTDDLIGRILGQYQALEAGEGGDTTTRRFSRVSTASWR